MAGGCKQQEPVISLARQKFLVPDRAGMPELAKYARVVMPGGEQRIAGSTEATRGCKHLCRHCPIVPVYNGAFRVVDREVVLEDIRQQVAAGAQHITFGDPDFFNGPAHALSIVEAMHREFPELSYDVTIKIEHLRKHDAHLATLRDTGCLFVISAVESVDDAVLEKFDKGHTRADFLAVVARFRELGMTLLPTFVPFTPWTTLAGYKDLLDVIAEQGLVRKCRADSARDSLADSRGFATAGIAGSARDGGAVRFRGAGFSVEARGCARGRAGARNFGARAARRRAEIVAHGNFFAYSPRRAMRRPEIARRMAQRHPHANSARRCHFWMSRGIAAPSRWTSNSFPLEKSKETVAKADQFV